VEAQGHQNRPLQSDLEQEPEATVDRVYDTVFERDTVDEDFLIIPNRPP